MVCLRGNVIRPTGGHVALCKGLALPRTDSGFHLCSLLMYVCVDIRNCEAVQHPVGQPLPVSPPGWYTGCPACSEAAGRCCPACSEAAGRCCPACSETAGRCCTVHSPCPQDMVVKFAAMNSHDLLEASEKAVSVHFVIVLCVCMKNQRTRRRGLT